MIVNCDVHISKLFARKNEIRKLKILVKKESVLI